MFIEITGDTRKLIVLLDDLSEISLRDNPILLVVSKKSGGWTEIAFKKKSDRDAEYERIKTILGKNP